MLNPFKLLAVYRDLNKLEVIAKEKATMKLKLTQILTLLISLAGTIGVPALATNWLQAHVAIYTGFVAAALLLHAVLPSIFSAPSAADAQATGLNKVSLILLMIALSAMCAGRVQAQTTATTTSTTATGISFTVSTGAAAVVGDGGNKYVIATVSQLLDLWDSKADSNGYKNRVYLLGDEVLGDATAGWNYYGGGVRVEPSRALAGLLKSTNIPADSFKLYFDGSVGNTISTASVSNFSGLLGGGINVAMNSSGSVSWHPFQAKWLRRGGKNYGVLATEIVAKW